MSKVGLPGRTAIVTCMKNEGPFILEWIAYHRVIGVDDFLVYTNDCVDGTEELLDALAEQGVVIRRDNPFKGTDMKPQHAALQAAAKEQVVKDARWLMSMDVDEFINIKCGAGTLGDLYEATEGFHAISMTWRLFGNANVTTYEDKPILSQFRRCAQEKIPVPHQAWGFKTLYRNDGRFRRLGVHRPQGFPQNRWDKTRWLNGSGDPLPQDMFKNSWRSNRKTFGYDLVQLNHYSLRSAESFLVKRDRGRVNHVDRDQGLAYWFRMNNNCVKDTSIMRMIPELEKAMGKLLDIPRIKAAHEACCAAHRDRINLLKSREDYNDFFGEITGDRLRTLSMMHRHFGRNVFLRGPTVIPDIVLKQRRKSRFFFDVEKGETVH